MKLSALLIACFWGAIGLSFSKFFILGHLSSGPYETEDKAWVIQILNALMTIGPVLAYAVSAALVSVFQKRSVMTICPIIAGALFYLGYLSDWVGTEWLYAFGIGLVLSPFGAGKMSVIPYESNESGRTPYFINALLAILFVLGILLGIPFGAYAYADDPDSAALIGLGVFLAAGIFSYFLKYEEETFVEYRFAYRETLKRSVYIARRYLIFLLTAPMAWGVAGAVSLAVTAYVEEVGIGTATSSSLMPLYAPVGFVIGNAISTRLVGVRHKASIISGMLMLLLVAVIPLLISMALSFVADSADLYPYVMFYMILLGCFFGIFTNLIDAEYMKLVGEEKMEGVGAALHSMVIAFFSFIVGGIVGLCILFELINSTAQFVLLAVFSLLGVIPLFRLKQKTELN